MDAWTSLCATSVIIFSANKEAGKKVVHKLLFCPQVHFFSRFHSCLLFYFLLLKKGVKYCLMPYLIIIKECCYVTEKYFDESFPFDSRSFVPQDSGAGNGDEFLVGLRVPTRPTIWLVVDSYPLPIL